MTTRRGSPPPSSHPTGRLIGWLCVLCVSLLAPNYLESNEPTAALTSDAEAGRHPVDLLEFPDVKDASRNGRRVPIKLHVPSGAGPFPLVVVSHGGGGHWDANFAQAHHLATHGFLVMCLEHVGSNTEVMKRSFRLGKNLREMTRDAKEVLGRPQDVSLAIDQAEGWSRAHEKLRGRIDLERVGILGHSFGAYTTLVVCGMRPALDWLTPVVPPGKGLGPDLSDPRVDCGVALSPQGPGEPFFIDASFATLTRPLLGISGSKDRQQMAEPENRRRGFELWPPGDKYFLWLTKADHMAFSDSTGSSHRMMPSSSRHDAQPLVRAATVRFFRAYLQRDVVARRQLSVKSLQPFCQGEVTTVEVLTKIHGTAALTR